MESPRSGGISLKYLLVSKNPTIQGIKMFNWYALVIFAVLFFAYQSIANVKTRDSLILIILLSFALPFVKTSPDLLAEGFLKTYTSQLAHYLVHVGIGGAIGLMIEKIS